MVARVSDPQIAAGIECRRAWLVESTCGRGAGATAAEVWLADDRIGFDAAGIRKGRQVSQHPIVTEIGDIQISVQRIDGNASGQIKALRTDAQGIGILRPRLSKHQGGSISSLIGRRVRPRQHARVARVRNIQMGLPTARIQCDAARLIQLYALHQVQTILVKVRLPEDTICGGRHLGVRCQNRQQRNYNSGK